MYLLDKRKNMPYRKGFLRKKLKYRKKLSKRGNVDMGMHYIQLAAEGGNAEAQSMLKDMGIDFDASQQTAGSTGTVATPEQSPVAANVASQGQMLESSGVLMEMLADRESSSPGTAQNASVSQNKGSGSTNQTSTSRGSGSGEPTRAASGGTVASAQPGGGTGNASGNTRSRRTSSRGRSAVAPPDETVMDSEMGDAVIID